MADANTDPRRRVPETEAVLADPRLVAALDTIGAAGVRAAVHAARDRARRGEILPGEVADTAVATLPVRAASVRPVLNATGVVVNTNLGRAPLSAAAVEAMVAAAGHTDTELDLATGRRARRGRGALEALAAAVPAAGDVHVVTNGAAALVLTATALASGREIVISRRDLLAIGTELLMSTGARLRTVGTATHTTRADYRTAVGPATGFVLAAPRSACGDRATVDVAGLADLPVPVVVELGAGLLAPDPLLPAEPDAATVLRAGAALVTASGDTLLGGPQAGLLLGRADLVQRLRHHPLAPAFRPDRLALAALEATLRGPLTPTRQALTVEPDELRERVGWLREELTAGGVKADVVPAPAAVGAGAPGVELPSWAVALAEHYAAPLRQGDPPVVGRIEHGQLLLDLRCINPALDPVVRDAVLAI